MGTMFIQHVKQPELQARNIGGFLYLECRVLSSLSI